MVSTEIVMWKLSDVMHRYSPVYFHKESDFNLSY